MADTYAIADRLFAAIEAGTQIEPFSFIDPAFDVDAGYDVLSELHAWRRAGPATPEPRSNVPIERRSESVCALSAAKRPCRF